MRRTFIFDMGGVLLGHTMSDYIREFVNYNEEDYEFLKNMVSSTTWLELDRGLEIETGIEKLCEEAEHKRDELIKNFIHNFRMKEDPYPEMEELIHDIREKGYDVYLMSNVSLHYKNFFPLIKSISYMNDIWVSCERKLMKPEKEAYMDMFSMFNLKPEECFFIDDLKSNIDAAKECGMPGFVFKGNVAELREYIVTELEIEL